MLGRHSIELFFFSSPLARCQRNTIAFGRSNTFCFKAPLCVQHRSEWAWSCSSPLLMEKKNKLQVLHWALLTAITVFQQANSSCYRGLCNFWAALTIYFKHLLLDLWNSAEEKPEAKKKMPRSSLKFCSRNGCFLFGVCILQQKFNCILK